MGNTVSGGTVFLGKKALGGHYFLEKGVPLLVGGHYFLEVSVPGGTFFFRGGHIFLGKSVPRGTLFSEECVWGTLLPRKKCLGGHFLGGT